MTFRDDREGQDQSSSAGNAKTPASAKPKTGAKTGAKAGAKTGERRTRRRTPGGEVGHALRTVYDDTLNESIPPEMLDLLGKLG